MNTTAEAASLEEAIKGVGVNGFLRYRYTNMRFENLGYQKGHNGTSGSGPSHTGNMQGTGLGASEDGKIGVSTFYVTITPPNMQMQIDMGKMRTWSPLNDNYDDRFTGISIAKRFARRYA